jgi:hypothetical protein
MIYKRRTILLSRILIAFSLSVLFSSCGRQEGNPPASGPTSLGQVPAVRLSFRYEADVPAPPQPAPPTPVDERNPAIQADFDQNRAQEILDRTIASPDGSGFAAVYHRVSDLPAEFRIDMYSAEGTRLRKVTPDMMAVHFPDTILWSPDSSTLAFVAMLRADQEGGEEPAVPDVGIEVPIPEATDANENTEPVASPTPSVEEPAAVLTFRTEQIYICGKDGSGLRPITQSEGKIFFYFVWSPDSLMLASLVATLPEWKAMLAQSESKGEVFVPAGRPRIVEKNGRQRLLDDALTTVRPVWSPDSTKVGVGFDTQVRVYDGVGNVPTQAAIPLRNQLLISSQAYDQELQRQALSENSVADANAQPATPANSSPTLTLPDPATLVSFSPIIELAWPSDDLLYFQTGYVKEYKNPADNRRSFLRWHRLVLAPQPEPPQR